MEFNVLVKSHDCYGAHTTLSCIGHFLLKDAGAFGGAIQEITATLHLPDEGPARKTLAPLLARHNAYRSTLPKVTFRRAKFKMEIDIASEVMDARQWEPTPRVSLALFKRGVEEIVQALGLVQKRLKPTDDFDFTAFLAQCASAKGRIPTSQEALQDLAQALAAEKRARFAALSPWDQLGIDWDDFHPAARNILNDVFFWDGADDFSPNGNDTGADLLADYRQWLKRHTDGQATRFLQHLARKWGYANVDAMDEDTLCEAWVGLAFADIKLRGTCDAAAHALAQQGIERQRAHALAASDWPLRDLRLKTLEQIDAKLKAVTQ